MADVIPGLPKGHHDRRKLYVYGGLAVALLVVIMLRRRSDSATQAAADPSSGQLTPVSNPAAIDGSAGVASTGVDNGSQLASFENALIDQLPDVISSSINAGFANWQPAPSPAAATDPTTPSPTVFDPGALLTAAAGLINIGTGLAGASNAASKSSPAASNVKATVHPVVATHGTTPGASYTVETNVTRGGVKGVLHHYSDGRNVFVPAVRTP